MELIVYAPVWGQSGFEHLSRNLFMALDQMGVTIELRPANEWNGERLALPPNVVSRLDRMCRTKVNPLAPHVVYQLPKGQPVHKDAPALCYTLFETDRVPPMWVDVLNTMDRVLVFSEFNRKSWSATGIPSEKLGRLPAAVDSFVFNPDGPKLEIENREGFTFLCSGDFTERKNFEAVIEAFVTEFDASERVTLIFKCHYGGFSKRHRRACMDKLRDIALRFNPKNPPRILFWGDKVSEYAMASLYRSVDCFVLASRGEGLGMQYLEAMASGTPVVACDWGAQTDYLTTENAYLVRSTLKTIDDPYYIQKCIQALNSKWCQVDIGDLKKTMRHVFENYGEAHGKAQLALGAAREMTWHQMAVAFIREVIHMYDHATTPAAAGGVSQ